jgi:hypothetical protein
VSEPNDGDTTNDQPFDPYRFGAPDRPVPPEYAPPGYEKTGYHPPTPAPDPNAPPAPASPYGPPTSGPAYGQQPGQYPGQQPGAYPGGYPGQPYGPPGYGPPPYGQPGFGQPPFPGYGHQQPPTNGKATAGMWLGIASILLCWLTFLDLVPIILGFVFSAQGLGEARRRGLRSRAAKAGIWCAALGTACVLALLVGAVVLINKTDCTVAHPDDRIAAAVCRDKNR